MKVHLAYNMVQRATDIFRNEFTPAQLVRIFDREEPDNETKSLFEQLRECDEIVEDIPVVDVKVYGCELANWIFTELAAKHGLTR